MRLKKARNSTRYHRTNGQTIRNRGPRRGDRPSAPDLCRTSSIGESKRFYAKEMKGKCTKCNLKLYFDVFPELQQQDQGVKGSREAIDGVMSRPVQSGLTASKLCLLFLHFARKGSFNIMQDISSTVSLLHPFNATPTDWLLHTRRRCRLYCAYTPELCRLNCNHHFCKKLNNFRLKNNFFLFFAKY